MSLREDADRSPRGFDAVAEERAESAAPVAPAPAGDKPAAGSPARPHAPDGRGR